MSTAISTTSRHVPIHTPSPPPRAIVHTVDGFRAPHESSRRLPSSSESSRRLQAAKPHSSHLKYIMLERDMTSALVTRSDDIKSHLPPTLTFIRSATNYLRGPNTACLKFQVRVEGSTKELIRKALDDSTPIADFQGNKKLIPYCQMWGNTAATDNEYTSELTRLPVAKTIGKLSQHAVTNQSQDPFPERRTGNQRMGRSSRKKPPKETEQRRIARAGGNGRPPRKPADQRHRPARFPREKVRGATQPGIETNSPCWEASSLAAEPPQPRRHKNKGGGGRTNIAILPVADRNTCLREGDITACSGRRLYRLFTGETALAPENITPHYRERDLEALTSSDVEEEPSLPLETAQKRWGKDCSPEVRGSYSLPILTFGYSPASTTKGCGDHDVTDVLDTKKLSRQGTETQNGKVVVIRRRKRKKGKKTRRDASGRYKGKVRRKRTEETSFCVLNSLFDADEHGSGNHVATLRQLTAKRESYPPTGTNGQSRAMPPVTQRSGRRLHIRRCTRLGLAADDQTRTLSNKAPAAAKAFISAADACRYVRKQTNKRTNRPARMAALECERARAAQASSDVGGRRVFLA
ncbi:hypothetical protein PR048_014200 [Dryococelus australis]|uniref:Uncharacterized protein n=1 Tax=Dryococelus australis TaxID=614101 RepID=A0ABQ9HDI7_9NEOP|nr:hypothetical protein PR048_014200 [Dryococelus australis]